jgi:FkbM family methyltransferase
MKRQFRDLLLRIKQAADKTPVKRIPGLASVYQVFKGFSYPDGVTEMKFNGMTILIDLDEDIGRRIYDNGINRYEPSATSAIRRNVSLGDQIVEVGGHYGVHTLLFRDIVGKKGSVSVFEPDPKNAELLRKSIHRNGFDNINLFELGCADKKNTTSLQRVSGGSGRGFISSAEGREGFKGNIERTFEIETTTLKSHLDNENISHVDFIKIDVEGAELAVLQGLGDRIHDVDAMLIEIHSGISANSRNEIIHQLNETGQLSTIDGNIDIKEESQLKTDVLYELNPTPESHVLWKHHDQIV